MKGYLVQCTWQWTIMSHLHTAYYFAASVDDLLQRLTKIRSMIYWQEEPVRIGQGMSGRSILFIDYYVHEVEL